MISSLDMIRFVREFYPEYKGQLFLNMTDLANVFGLSQQKMRQHIIENAVPFYKPCGTKMYCVLEVLDSIKKTRYKA